MPQNPLLCLVPTLFSLSSSAPPADAPVEISPDNKGVRLASVATSSVGTSSAEAGVGATALILGELRWVTRMNRHGGWLW